MRCQDTGTAANWSNAVQALCESLPHGIPANVCSDPRHGAGQAGAEYKSDGSDTSKWPEGLAMAAAFDPELCREAAEIISREYRALGITTALSPQLDLGTEPRWMRVEDTFGTSPELVTEMGRVYCEAMQGTEEKDTGRCRDGLKAGVRGMLSLMEPMMLQDLKVLRRRQTADMRGRRILAGRLPAKLR